MACEQEKGVMLALAIALVVLLYLVVHINLSVVDKEHCEDHGMDYKGTNYLFVATCLTPEGKEIPANLVGNKNWKGE